ncbi:MAG TPA: nitroreductase family protein [Cytophagaceae bacterium]|jgi:nitroreductase|nr:nitroreductase family protein [Cytophagaceae bacterium]
MEKTTVAEHTVLNEIKTRKSNRAYSEKPVEQEKINSIIEAARWAPSSMNDQPWRYLVVTKDNLELYQAVFETLADFNKTWVKDAPVLVISLVRKNFTYNGVPNRHALYDTGAANSLLCVQASALGLNAHQMGGFDYEKLKNLLNLPQDMDIAVVIAIGYPDSPDKLSEELKKREIAPRERYTVHELIRTTGF